MSTWKKTKTELLLKHPRISVYEDEIILHNGIKSTYLHFGKKCDSVAIIAINKDDKILVQKEYSYPPNKWLYQFPGGGVEKGESLIQAAKRELHEEANLKGELKKIGWYYTDNRRKKDKQIVFIARDIQYSKGKKDIEELFEEYWYSEIEIDRLIKKGEIVIESFLAAWSIFKTVNGCANH